MRETDPHIHVEQAVVQAGGAVRSAMVSILGVVPDTPSVVTTGCGLEVPYAMTSPRPESVTCLACRDHAHRAHLRFADGVRQASLLPGINISSEDAAKAIARHQDLAQRFASSPD